MASSSRTHFSNLLFFTLLLFISNAIVSESVYEFRVGGPRGWIIPTGNETETYNQWATRNRFHIGDSLYFKYKNDSVLVVDARDYISCNTTEAIFTYNDGNTVFKFDHYGFCYFISGDSGHCKSGQKLVVWVMGQSDSKSLEAAPSPWAGPGQGTSSSPSSVFPTPNSTIKLRVGFSSFFAALRAMIIIFLFI